GIVLGGFCSRRAQLARESGGDGRVLRARCARTQARLVRRAAINDEEALPIFLGELVLSRAEQVLDMAAIGLPQKAEKLGVAVDACDLLFQGLHGFAIFHGVAYVLAVLPGTL